MSVLDDTGKLLSMPPDGSGDGMGVDAEQLQYVQQIEQQYSRRILDILEPMVGRNNVKAQVTAELDFTQTESTIGVAQAQPDTRRRSRSAASRLVESPTGQPHCPTAGVPGATTNQPPAPPSGAYQRAPQALAAKGNRVQLEPMRAPSGNPSSTTRSTRPSAWSRALPASIKRINAAVVLNNQSTTDDKGKTTSMPLTEAQMEKMTALVRETIGFNKDRGDSVNLMNAAFAPHKSEVQSICRCGASLR